MNARPAEPSNGILEAIRRLLVTHPDFRRRMTGDITDAESLSKRGVLDSLGRIELVVQLEKLFKIRFDPADLTPDNFDSVRRLADLVARRTGAAPGSGGHG